MSTRRMATIGSDKSSARLRSMLTWPLISWFSGTVPPYSMVIPGSALARSAAFTVASEFSCAASLEPASCSVT